MKLAKILEGLEYQTDDDITRTEISSVQYDSRKCSAGTLFVALRGSQSDGHHFIKAAVHLCVAAVVCEEIPVEFTGSYNTIFILVKNSRYALAVISKNWFGNPSKNLNIYGITGTNGKTTTTFLIRTIFEEAGRKTGIIGTTGIYYGSNSVNPTHTTPESLELTGYIKEMQNSGTDSVAIEISSHALSQYRADGIAFRAGLFTNLTLDHLDYHKTTDEYAKAKKRLFEILPDDSIALVFDNSEFTDFMLKNIRCRNKFLLGRTERADIQIVNERLSVNDSQFRLIFKKSPSIHQTLNLDIKIPLIGRFNIDNAAMAASLAYLENTEPEIIRSGLAKATGAPGRMQRIQLKNGASGIVDYAHTPDALEKALAACRNVLESSESGGRLICVFGCGGDRDTSKRPIMGRISSELADYTVVTSDNPRTEDPDNIISQIYEGIDNKFKSKLVQITNREEAINYAFNFSEENDIILVAGKGHEIYQIIGTEKLHFDDSEELRKYGS